ncbi:MAG: T9SS type A sorting domain-containing protein [Candidatus Electryonea clarkiae]|nr:T9SS type A sorting domain-containing protein [Candidatus Electryonea clarkiae]MDP8286226.1 T9SS type A sorting domain-containing protein [Candidatus Electryonea clarkiae]
MRFRFFIFTIAAGLFLSGSYSFAQINFTRHQLLDEDEFIGRTYGERYITDIDNDADHDIVVGYGENIQWYENDGQDNFTRHTIITDNIYNFRWVFGDLDDDEDTDIATYVVSDGYFALYWWENDGDQVFTEHFIGQLYNNAESDQIAFAIGDCDNDNDLDLINGSYSGVSFDMWLNDGTGTFERNTLFEEFYADMVVIIDLEDDGDVDFITGGAFIRWLENDGNFNMTNNEVYYVGINSTQLSLFCEDMDLDGDIDIGITNQYDFPIVFENTGDEEFTEHQIIEELTRRFAPADIDGDRDVDIFSIHAWGDEVSWFEHDGDMGFELHEIDTILGAVNLEVIDYDFDGDYDLVTFHGNDNHGVYWYENDLDPSPPEDFDLSWPINYSTVTENEVEVGWETAEDDDPVDVIEYTVQWSLDENFPEEATYSGTTIDTLFIIENLGELDELPEDTTIFWRVLATDYFGFTKWANGDSSGWSFTIDLTPKPYDLVADLNGVDGSVTLTWEHGPYPVEIEDLIYDDDGRTGFTRSPNTTMATRMSPEQPCRLHELSFFISTDTEGGEFNAEIYGWDGEEPSTELTYESVINNLPQTDGEWITLNVYSQRLFFNEDFVIGFGSVDAITNLAVDADNDNGRSWELSGGEWSTWTETYFIRALVQYTDTRYDELDGFIRFNVYRNGEEISRTTETTYTDQLDDYDNYEYSVTALYDDGESDPAGPVQVRYTLVNEWSFTGIPEKYEIVSVYPNPFNPSVTAVIALPHSSYLRVSIFNLLGQEIAVLVDGHLTAGHHTLTFDAHNQSSGIYLIKAVVPGQMNEMRKVLLMK